MIVGDLLAICYDLCCLNVVCIVLIYCLCILFADCVCMVCVWLVGGSCIWCRVVVLISVLN